MCPRSCSPRATFTATTFNASFNFIFLLRYRISLCTKREAYAIAVSSSGLIIRMQSKRQTAKHTRRPAVVKPRDEPMPISVPAPLATTKSNVNPVSVNPVCVNPVSAFLASLQLQGYAHTLVVENGFDTLPLLALHIRDEHDLIEMGIRPLAHRRSIMGAISKMRRIWLAASGDDRGNARALPEHAVPPQSVLYAPPSISASRSTVRLEPRPSFAEQIAMFKMGCCCPAIPEVAAECLPASSSVGPSVVQFAEAASHAHVKDDETSPADDMGTRIVILSGNTVGACTPRSPGNHKNTRGAVGWSTVDTCDLQSDERRRRQGDALTDLIMASEASYAEDMDVLKDDAVAAATTLTELFQRRAEEIDLRRQERLEEVGNMVGVADRHLLDDAAEAALRQGCGQRVSGWVFSVHLEPSLIANSESNCTPKGTRRSLDHRAPSQVGQPDPSLSCCSDQRDKRSSMHDIQQLAHRVLEEGDSHVRVPCTQHSAELPRDNTLRCEPLIEFATPPEQQQRVLSSGRRSSSTKAMRNSVRRVEHWLSDDVMVSLVNTPAPPREASGVAVDSSRPLASWRHSVVEVVDSQSTAHPSEEVRGTQSKADLLTAEDKEEDRRASHTCAAVDDGVDEADTLTAPSDHNETSQSSLGDEGSVVALINTHVSCSQQPPVLASTSTSSHVVKSLPHRFVDVVDVDEVSSYECTTVSSDCQSFPTNSLVQPTADVTVRNDDALPLAGPIEDTDDDIIVGEAYDRFGDVEMGDECIYDVALSTSESSDAPVKGTCHALSDETALLFNDEEDNKDGGGVETPSTPTAMPRRPPPLSPPPRGAVMCASPRTPASQAQQGNAGRQSIVGVLLGSMPTNAPRVHDRYTREAILAMTNQEALRVCAEYGVVVATQDPVVGVKRPREVLDQLDGDAARLQLCLLRTRSAFLHGARELLWPTVPSCCGQRVAQVTRQNSSLPRLQEAERNALTQAELHDVRRQLRNAEAIEATNALVACLAHQSLCSTIANGNDLDEVGLRPGGLLTTYESALLGEGVDMEDVCRTIRCEFPSMPKVRIEAALKASGVPINVAKGSPMETKRRQYFTQGWAGGRSRGR
jgi:hypothetical protein